MSSSFLICAGTKSGRLKVREGKYITRDPPPPTNYGKSFTENEPKHKLGEEIHRLTHLKLLQRVVSAVTDMIPFFILNFV